MKKTITGIVMLCATSISLVLSGCGSGNKEAGTTAAPPVATVSGVAATGAPIAGIAYLKDSSTPAREQSVAIRGDGYFAIAVDGLTPPFILKAEWGTGNTTNALHSFAEAAGTANINPLSNVAVANAAGVSDPATLYASADPSRLQAIAGNLPAAVSTLQAKIQPLLDLYGANIDPIKGAFVANHTGMDAMFDAVQINMSAGNVVMTNRSTSAPIFSAPVNNIASGTMMTANMPPAAATPFLRQLAATPFPHTLAAPAPPATAPATARRPLTLPRTQTASRKS